MCNAFSFFPRASFFMRICVKRKAQQPIRVLSDCNEVSDLQRLKLVHKGRLLDKDLYKVKRMVRVD